jgi:hypothetical protein
MKAITQMLTMPEAAAALDISLATAERYWTFATPSLYAELAGDPTRKLAKKFALRGERIRSPLVTLSCNEGP